MTLLRDRVVLSPVTSVQTSLFAGAWPLKVEVHYRIIWGFSDFQPKLSLVHITQTFRCKTLTLFGYKITSESTPLLPILPAAVMVGGNRLKSALVNNKQIVIRFGLAVRH